MGFSCFVVCGICVLGVVLWWWFGYCGRWSWWCFGWSCWGWWGIVLLGCLGCLCSVVLVVVVWCCGWGFGCWFWCGFCYGLLWLVDGCWLCYVVIWMVSFGFLLVRCVFWIVCLGCVWSVVSVWCWELGFWGWIVFGSCCRFLVRRCFCGRKSGWRCCVGSGCKGCFWFSFCWCLVCYCRKNCCRLLDFLFCLGWCGWWVDCLCVCLWCWIWFGWRWLLFLCGC